MNPPQSSDAKPASVPASASPWQVSLARAITDPAELIRALRLDPAFLPAARQAARLFPLRVTRHFVGLMRPRDPTDPLLRQVLPLEAELAEVPGYTADPVDDRAALRGPGVLQKYHGRALLLTTGACAVHCRYCFRRHYPYADARPAHDGWRGALRSIAALPDVEEVILSGGDPLTLSDERLAALVTAIERLPQIRRLRLHSRVPVVLPERLTPGLLELLRHSRLQVALVIHCNHPNELTDPLAAGLHALQRRGVALLNQAVLLRGVNDAADVLAALSTELFGCGVLPYYLHRLDPVAGAAHFDVPDQSAIALLAALRTRLPGYLVPRLVEERPGAPAKLPLHVAPGGI
jgi:EF-P beta-lysylation protein EpmB